MAKVRADEVLGKAVSTDSVAVPRYDLVAPDGTAVATNVTLSLKNPIVQQGMNVDKVAMDECLAASGLAGGTKKALTLSQENFALFDGAPVRIKLFDTLSGAATLNVNNTGAKRIKTSSDEDPDGFIKDMWVDLVYSADKDQYVIIGGSAAYSLGANINILEEVESMKFCKVVTLDSGEQDNYSEWMRLGVISGICETENYRWYARLCEASTTIDFLRVAKVGGEVRSFKSGAFSTIPFPAGTLHYISNDNQYGYTANGKLQLIPVRNGDCIIFAAITAFYSQEYNGNQWTYVNMPGIMVGVVFPDLNVYTDTNLIRNFTNSDRYNGVSLVMCTQIGLLNGYLSDDGSTLFYTGFTTYSNFAASGTRMFPGTLRALSTVSHTMLWEYIGTNRPTTAVGRAVWILDETSALWFAGWNEKNANYAGGKMTFTKSAAPAQETPAGTAAAWQGLLYTDYRAPFCSGWYVSKEKHEVGLVGFDYRGPAGITAGTSGYAKLLAINTDTNTVRTVYHVIAMEAPSDRSRASWFCLPGYVDNPYVFFIGSQTCNIQMATNELPEGLLRRETVGTGISLDDDPGMLQVPFFTDCFAPWIYKQGDQYSSKYMFSSPSAVADLFRKSGCFTGATGIVTFADGSITKIRPTGILWHCEEDGVYKFIMVGGGGPGSLKKAGNAGSITVASCFIAAGTDVLLQPGHGGAMLPTQEASILGLMTNASAVSLGPGGPANTVVKIGDTILMAAAAKNWQDNGPAPYGGVHSSNAKGNNPKYGGGAGGYDLSVYGGNGVDDMDGVRLLPDRNGGKSGETGNPTGGVGYGAGGTFLQPGNNGCIVIIR